jgi:predicted secreted protein
VSWATIAAIYFLIWWIVLFAVLPWGVRSQEESGDVVSGTDPGAPSVPRLLMKIVWTTIVATIVFAAFYVSYVYRLVTIESLATLFGFPLTR